MLSMKGNSNTGILILKRRGAFLNESREGRTGKVAEKKAGKQDGPKGGERRRTPKRRRVKSYNEDAEKEA